MQYSPITRSPIINIKNPVPPVFYKYTPIEDWLPSLLNGSSLKFTSRNNFNDPFDSRSSMHLDYSSKDAEQHIRSGIADLNLYTPEQVDEITKIIIESEFQINENSNIEKSLDNTGILSLASSWNNILLWSHYAKHHTGICIGFNSTKDVFRTAQKVSYYSDFPIIMRPQDSPDTILKKTFLRKSLCWAYEKEWRVIKPQWSNDEKNEFFKRSENSRIHRFVRDFDGPNTYKFEKKSIINVTLGMNVDDEDEKKVIAAIKAANIDIKLYKASREKDRYKVKRVEISI